MKKVLLAMILLFVSGHGYAEVVETTNKKDLNSVGLDTAQTKPNYIMCRNNNVVRTIRIEKKGRSCRTTYTKDGVDSTVGKSGSMALCQDVFDKIKDNLEKALWKCKDITQARVSTSIGEP